MADKPTPLTTYNTLVCSHINPLDYIPRFNALDQKRATTISEQRRLQDIHIFFEVLELPKVVVDNIVSRFLPFKFTRREMYFLSDDDIRYILRPPFPTPPLSCTCKPTDIVIDAFRSIYKGLPRMPSHVGFAHRTTISTLLDSLNVLSQQLPTTSDELKKRISVQLQLTNLIDQITEPILLLDLDILQPPLIHSYDLDRLADELQHCYYLHLQEYNLYDELGMHIPSFKDKVRIRPSIQTTATTAAMIGQTPSTSAAVTPSSAASNSRPPHMSRIPSSHSHAGSSTVTSPRAIATTKIAGQPISHDNNLSSSNHTVLVSPSSSSSMPIAPGSAPAISSLPSSSSSSSILSNDDEAKDTLSPLQISGMVSPLSPGAISPPPSSSKPHLNIDVTSSHPTHSYDTTSTITSPGNRTSISTRPHGLSVGSSNSGGNNNIPPPPQQQQLGGGNSSSSSNTSTTSSTSGGARHISSSNTHSANYGQPAFITVNATTRIPPPSSSSSGLPPPPPPSGLSALNINTSTTLTSCSSSHMNLPLSPPTPRSSISSTPLPQDDISRLRSRFAAANRLTWAPMLRDKSTAADIRQLLSSFSFHIFDYAASHRPELLIRFVIFMFVDLGLVHRFDLSISKLVRFTSHVSTLYRNNPYHNWEHAFTTLQYTYLLIIHTQYKVQYPDIYLLAMLLSALCHDLDHPGNSNAFEVSTSSTLALAHNDTSVLENHHCFVTWSLLKQPQFALFEHLSSTHYKDLRGYTVHIILSTDMTVHNSLIDELKTFTQTIAENKIGSTFNFNTICKILVHCADIAGQVLPLPAAFLWAERLRLEFCNQTETEKRLGITVTPFMLGIDSPQLYARSQDGFIAAVLRPMWAILTSAFPALKPSMEQLRENQLFWNFISDYSDTEILSEDPYTHRTAVESWIQDHTSWTINETMVTERRRLVLETERLVQRLASAGITPKNTHFHVVQSAVQTVAKGNTNSIIVNHVMEKQAQNDALLERNINKELDREKIKIAMAESAAAAAVAVATTPSVDSNTANNSIPPPPSPTALSTDTTEQHHSPSSLLPPPPLEMSEDDTIPPPPIIAPPLSDKSIVDSTSSTSTTPQPQHTDDTVSPLSVRTVPE